LTASFLRGYPFPRGTLCAFLGLVLISLYFRFARQKLRKAPQMLGEPDSSAVSTSQSWPELRHMQAGATLSIAVFLIAGAADAANNWLDRLVGVLLGLCGTIAVAMLGVGFVSLLNLWKELIQQLRKASLSSLLVSIPLAILWLALGLGVFVSMGMLLEKIGAYVGPLLRPLLWSLIALIFWGLWKGRSRAALMLRLILLTSFSAIILAAAVFTCWYASSQTAPLLVLSLLAIGYLNVVFYSHFLRDTALRDNLIDTSNADSRSRLPD
jgi:hypothetical protein